MQIPFNMIHCTYAYEMWLKLFVFLQLQKHVPFIDQMTNRHILARMTKQATLKSHGLEPRYSFKFISAETQWFITSFHPFAHFWMGTMLREDVTYGYAIVISCIYFKVCPVMSPFASYIPNLSHVGQVNPNVQSVDPPVWTMFCMSSRYAPRSQQLDTQKVNPSPVIFKDSSRYIAICQWSPLLYWLVVYQPLWKIWLRQLGLFPAYGKIKAMFQTTNQFYIAFALQAGLVPHVFSHGRLDLLRAGARKWAHQSDGAFRLRWEICRFGLWLMSAILVMSAGKFSV